MNRKSAHQLPTYLGASRGRRPREIPTYLAALRAAAGRASLKSRNMPYKNSSYLYRYFDFCVHDPPTSSMSGELFSLAVYKELRRVLREGGTLFHYVGDPQSKASGKLFKGVLERLRAAGFSPKTNAKAFGITAVAVADVRSF